MKSKKSKIVQFRLSPEDLAILESCAKSRHLDVSDYIRMNVLEAASKDIKEIRPESNVLLTPEEWDRFMEIMRTPSDYNPHLQQAFKNLADFETDQDNVSEQHYA